MSAERRPPPDPARLAVRERLKALAHELLAHAAQSGVELGKPLLARAGNHLHSVEVRLASASASGVPGVADTVPPMFFSPIEAAVVNGIGPAGEMLGKQIAGVCGQDFAGPFRARLSNLVARGVLAKGKTGQAYRWSDAFRKMRGAKPEPASE